MARCLTNDNQIHCQNNANSSNLFRMKNHLLAKSHQAYAVMRVHVHVAENCPSLWNPRHPCCSDPRPHPSSQLSLSPLGQSVTSGRKPS